MTSIMARDEIGNIKCDSSSGFISLSLIPHTSLTQFVINNEKKCIREFNLESLADLINETYNEHFFPIGPRAA